MAVTSHGRSTRPPSSSAWTSNSSKMPLRNRCFSVGGEVSCSARKASSGWLCGRRQLPRMTKEWLPRRRLLQLARGGLRSDAHRLAPVKVLLNLRQILVSPLLRRGDHPVLPRDRAPRFARWTGLALMNNLPPWLACPRLDSMCPSAREAQTWRGSVSSPPAPCPSFRARSSPHPKSGDTPSPAPWPRSSATMCERNAAGSVRQLQNSELPPATSSKLADFFSNVEDKISSRVSELLRSRIRTQIHIYQACLFGFE